MEEWAQEVYDHLIETVPEKGWPQETLEEWFRIRVESGTIKLGHAVYAEDDTEIKRRLLNLSTRCFLMERIRQPKNDTLNPQ